MAIDQVGQGSILIKGEINKSQLQKTGKDAVRTVQGAANASPVKLNLDFGKSGALSKFPLGRITNDINAFQGALDASIARTLAFAVSAGALTAVTKGMKHIVSSAVEVEKQMIDINVLFGLSSDTLKRFEGQLFSVARNTAQSFKEVSIAAAEFARQGLSIEETQKRVNDALVLSRLSGLGVAESVATITASINGFNSEVITSSDVVNRLANVDASFAVSSADLAKSIARAGSVSQDAKVSFNELAAATTAVQQKTARGGAIIGNGFKSIFTRLQRSGVQETLEDLGVSTKNLNGEFRGAIPILQDYANIYKNLSDSIRASTDEQIAGVFQINNLKAIVSDLSSGYSVFREALDIASNSSNEAVVRNLELNKSLSAVAKSAAISAQEIASAFGQRIINTEFVKGGISAISNIFQSGADAFNKQGEDAGVSIGTFLADGIVSVVTGPLAAKVLLALTKITRFLIIESKKVFQQISTLGGNLSTVSEIQQKFGSLTTAQGVLIPSVARSRRMVSNVNISGVNKVGRAASGAAIVSKTETDIAKTAKIGSGAMLGLFFAAQSASSALENLSEEGSKASLAGKAASSGLKSGFFAAILAQAIPSVAASAGPIGLAVGGSVATLKFISDLTNDTKKLQKELSKASEEMSRTTKSISIFSQRQNQYNELLASSDIEKSSKVFRDLVLSAKGFGPEFSGRLVNSISRPEETGKIFEEISKVAKDAEKSAVIASALYKPKNPIKAGAEIGGLLTGTISRNAFADTSIENLSDKVNKTFEDIDFIVSSAKDREKSKLFSSENLKTASGILRFVSSRDPFALASLTKNVPKRFTEKNRTNENDFSKASALFTDLAKYAGIPDYLIKKTIESATSTESLNSAIKTLGDGIKKTNLADALAKLQEAINRPAISIRAALIDVEKSLRKDSENRKRNIEESQRVQSAVSSILRPITDASNISGYGQSLSRSGNISKASGDVESILQGFADTVFTELKANPQNASKIQSRLRPFLERGDIAGVGVSDIFTEDIPKSIKDSANETAQKLQGVIQEISDSNAYLAAIEVATKAVERFQSAEKRIVSGGVGYNTAFSRAFDVVSNNPTAKNSVIEERARLKAFQTASDAGFLNAEQEKQFQIDKARLGASARIAELSGIGNNAFLRSNISDLLRGRFGEVPENKLDATEQVLQDLEDYKSGLTGKTQENISKEVENIRSQVGSDLTGPTNIVSDIVGKITKAFSDQVDVVTKAQEEAKRENAKELESLEAERLQLIATMQAMEGFFKDNSSSNLAIDVNYNPEEFRKIIDVNVKKSIRGE